MRTALIIYVCYALAGVLGIEGQSSTPASELEKAREVFITRSRELGIRADSPRAVRTNSTTAARWRGRLYENLRNDYFDAMPHEIRQGGGKESILRRHQFGFNLTGPLVIPHLYHGGRRTFASASYEGVRDKTSRSFLQTIPTLPERSGDFSSLLDQSGNLLPIFDPLTTRSNPNFNPSQPVSPDNLEYLRDPFPDNRIPPNRLDPVAKALMKYYPEPNAAIGPFFQNNYFVADPETNNADGLLLKLDHNLSERNRLAFEASFSNGLESPARRLLSPANPGMPSREFISRRGSFGHSFAKSPGTVIQWRFVADTDISTSGEKGNPDYAGKVGLHGAGSEAFPAFRFEPYVQMGRLSPRSRSARTVYTWEGGYNLRRDRHSLQFTFQHRFEQLNVISSRYPSGSFRFGSGLTSLPGIVNTGHSFASFMLGLAEYAEKTYVVAPSYFRRHRGFFSFREQYEAARGLTFTVSLQLAHFGPRTEKYNRQSTIDLSLINPANGRPGAMIVAGTAGRGRAFQPHFVKLQPSVGIAWNPGGNPKLVLRAEYSRGYESGFLRPTQFATQAFNASPSYISSNVQLEPALKLADGVPPLGRPLPDLRPDALNDQVADLVDASNRQPTYQELELLIQRQLPFSVQLSAGFTLSGGKNILLGSEVAKPNSIPISALAFRDQLNDEAFNRSLRPYPQFKDFEVGWSYPLGRQQRKSGFIGIETRATAGLSINARYEIIRQYDDYSGRTGRQDYYDRRSEWFLTAFLPPQRFTLSYMYELPFGPGKSMLRFSDWRRRLVEGWAISGSTFVAGGDPIMLRPQYNNTGGVVAGLRVNVVPGVDPHVPNPGPRLWFNPAAFEHPEDFTIGNGPRTHPTLRNPINQNHDLSITKRFPLAAETSLELNAVALNFLNHANWNDPDAVIGTATAPNVNAGRIIGSRGGRIMQIGLRFSF